ncbi:MAG: HTH domain-containing protein, partial [Clostridiaceae bacterium]|nr:HTH domain-containing protein [Clostridiaceae bacterium]
VVEWKKQWNDEWLNWICGFANSVGGTLIIGKDDYGEAVGVANVDELMVDLPNKVRDTLGIIVEIYLVNENDKNLLEIKVPPYPVPISCKGSYYVRSGATNQRLSGHALESFILNKRGVSWDSLPLPGFTLQDISDRAIAHFRRIAEKKGRIPPDYLDEPKEILLERLGLIKQGYLTNAAMLLFSEDPQRWQQGAYVKIGFFRNHADLEYQDEIRGSLIDQIDRVIEVLHLKYMKARITYEGVQRIERYFVPDEALREAILNAICRKDYSRSIPVQISVTGIIRDPQNGTQNDTQSDPQNAYRHKREKISPEERRQSIISLIKQNVGITRRELAEKLAVSPRTIARDIEEIRNTVKLEYEGSAKAGRWILRDDTDD